VRGTTFDTDVANVNAADAQLKRLNAQTTLTLARLRLSRAIGLETPRLVQMAGALRADSPPRVPLERVLDIARRTRPEIAAASEAIRRSEIRQVFESANAIPDLELGPRFQDRFRDPSDSMGMRFSMDLPLWDRNQGGIAEGHAELRINQAMLTVAELTTLNDVASAWVELSPLFARLEYYQRRIVPLAERVERRLPQVFESGRVDAKAMITEQQRLARLREEHLNLRYRYNQLRVKLELFLGRSLSDIASDTDGAATAVPHEHASPTSAGRESQAVSRVYAAAAPGGTAQPAAGSNPRGTSAPPISMGPLGTPIFRTPGAATSQSRATGQSAGSVRRAEWSTPRAGSATAGTAGGGTAGTAAGTGRTTR
jgi:hypothetical protein